MAAKKLVLSIDSMFTIQSESDNQFLFLNNYHKYDVHLLLGLPGTGKSYLSLYRGIEDVLDKSSPYEKVVLIRSAVASRDIGFLPGNEEEKGSVYEKPYAKMASQLFDNRPDAYSRLKEQKHLEFELSSFLRGDTFDHCIIVVDEIQNMTYVELYTIITRVGVGSKIIFCGDKRQNDLGNKSGLDKFVKVLDNMSSCHKVVFDNIDDIVRSGIVKEFIIAEIEYELKTS